MSAGKFGRFKTEVEESIERREIAVNAKNQGGVGEILGEIRRFEPGGRNEKVLARSNGPRENAETVISCRGPEPARKKKELRHTGSREEQEEDAQLWPCGKAIESRTHIVGECEIYKEEWDVLENRDEGKIRMRHGEVRYGR